MRKDHAPTDDSADDECGHVRRKRFGHLPERIPPAEWVETVEAERVREIREPTEPRREWG